MTHTKKHLALTAALLGCVVANQKGNEGDWNLNDYLLQKQIHEHRNRKFKFVKNHSKCKGTR